MLAFLAWCILLVLFWPLGVIVGVVAIIAWVVKGILDGAKKL